jgi:hypothetical protein
LIKVREDYSTIAEWHLCYCRMVYFDKSQRKILQFQNGVFAAAEWILLKSEDYSIVAERHVFYCRMVL